MEGSIGEDRALADRPGRPADRGVRLPPRDVPHELSNRSQDITDLLCEHLDLLGIEWRRMNRWTISVARRESVAKLDAFVGPKR